MPNDEYLEAQVMTASPHRLHQLVVDGAIRHTKQAEIALEANDFEKSHFALSSARDFVTELIGGLDADPAPELVSQMKELFVFVYRRLFDADTHHDPQLAREALRILELHREAWVELGEQLTSHGSSTGNQTRTDLSG
jgi:flagellar protein FliS